MNELYTLPQVDAASSPYEHFTRLLPLPEFSHLREGGVIVYFMFFLEQKIVQGKRTLGMCALPRVQGKLSGVFSWLLGRVAGCQPDFIVLLDHEFWSDATFREREILVYHEMKHLGHSMDSDGELRFDEEGRPVWVVVPHDIEEFQDTVRRYGAYSEQLREFISAAAGGGGEDD